MSSIFCCNSTCPYKARRTDHEAKFTTFMDWARYPRGSSKTSPGTEMAGQTPAYAIQLVRQVNYGPLESKRYFINFPGSNDSFVEVSEEFLIEVNFQKVNSFKNMKCDSHNKFFELNLYQKDPVNKHHWRANLARPASNIDL